MLFRITRGKALTHSEEFWQGGVVGSVEKVAYLVVFSAAGGNKERMKKMLFRITRGKALTHSEE